MKNMQKDTTENKKYRVYHFVYRRGRYFTDGEDLSLEEAEKEFENTCNDLSNFNKNTSFKDEFLVFLDDGGNFFPGENLIKTAIIKRNGKILNDAKPKLHDKPSFNVENQTNEIWIDIPDEELTEWFKNKLVEVANNPRLIDKYRKDLEEMFKKDLQAYADDQYYSHGRGKVYKDSASSAYELHYDDLEVTIYGKMLYPDSIDGPAEYEESDETVEYDYEIDEDEAIEALHNKLVDLDEYKKMSEDELDKYIRENLDDLVEKYEDILKKYFRERATEKAQEYWQDYYDNYEPDYDDYD